MEDSDRQNPIENPVNLAGNRLEGFLNEHPNLIRAIRSYNQWRGSSAKNRFDMMGLVAQEVHNQMVQINGQGADSVLISTNVGTIENTAKLVDVFDDSTSEGPEHNVDFDETTGAIRGGRFRMDLLFPEGEWRHTYNFYICELDFGKSRTYFDHKDEEDKEEFVRQFALREIAEEEKHGTAPRNGDNYGAFISYDLKDKKYKIDKFVQLDVNPI
jgi:hypothetical protein